jgi:membrane-associated phospholipid phosphatase
MPSPIIAPSWRGPTLLAVIVAAAGVAALSIGLHDVSSTTDFDTDVNRQVFTHIGETGSQILLGLSEPALSTGLLVLIAVVAALARRWEVTALAVIGPTVALLVTEVVLKPLVNRTLVPDPVQTSSLINSAFPSGHETGLVSLLLVLGLLLPRLRVTTMTRAALVVVLVIWALLAAIGLVRGHYHYATDTVGGIGVAVAVVGSAALAIDRCGAVLATRDRQLTWRS